MKSHALAQVAHLGPVRNLPMLGSGPPPTRYEIPAGAATKLDFKIIVRSTRHNTHHPFAPNHRWRKAGPCTKRPGGLFGLEDLHNKSFGLTSELCVVDVTKKAKFCGAFLRGDATARLLFPPSFYIHAVGCKGRMRASVSAAFNGSARRKDNDAQKDARVDPREAP
jgi:hypothetical protein